MATQGTRCKWFGRAAVTMVVLATLLAGTVTPAMAADTRHASVSWSGVWNWLTRGTPTLRLPVQQAGTARGLPHYVPASATNGHRGRGYARGRGHGQLPPFRLHGPAGLTTRTRPYIENGAHSFNPATSKPVMSRATVTSTLYRNADGSYTRLVYTQPRNFKTPKGTWQPINTALTRTNTGRLRETANSAAISLAPSASNSALVSVDYDQTERVSYSLLGAARVRCPARPRPRRPLTAPRRTCSFLRSGKTCRMSSQPKRQVALTLSSPTRELAIQLSGSQTNSRRLRPTPKSPATCSTSFICQRKYPE